MDMIPRSKIAHELDHRMNKAPTSAHPRTPSPSQQRRDPPPPPHATLRNESEESFEVITERRGVPPRDHGASRSTRESPRRGPSRLSRKASAEPPPHATLRNESQERFEVIIEPKRRATTRP